jgi:tetrahydromethanopterin S-methyltransferase subunit G|tara:strand:- start:852 stop:1022 length:171 start_codon:yes stop_codon:yes gene_type:complete
MEVLMKADEVLKLLEKHEAQCDKRYAEIQDKLKSLDGRVWGLYGVIIGVAVLEKIF